MSDEDKWQDQFEDDGITLGPEEALQREIEKSKTLKVERLKLKDENEKLRIQNNRLIKENDALQKEVQSLRNQLPQAPVPENPNRSPSHSLKTYGPRTWVAVVCILLGVMILLFILTR